MAMKKQLGFTIIELMIVLAVIGIVTTIGMPSMRDIMLNQQVRTAASDAHVSMLMTRSEAIKRNTNVDMASANWGDSWDVQVPGAPPTVLRSMDSDTNLTVECNTDGDDSSESCPTEITFNRTGRPASLMELRFFVSGNPRITMRCVMISLSGIPRINIDSDDDSTNGCN
jgi:prepilin-type N-terminal cleavage/methylation domain-containing protein